MHDHVMSCDQAHATLLVAVAMSYWAIQTLRRVAADLQNFQDEIPADVVDSSVLSLQIAYRELLVQEQLDGLCLDPAAALLREAMKEIKDEASHHPQLLSPSLVYSGGVGRPRFDLPDGQLTALVENGFTGPQIALIVGVSLSTVRRRMAEFGVTVSSQYSQLSDEGPDQLVIDIKELFPTCGNKQMLGHLRSRGYRIQQIRVRESLMRVDPEGSVMRRLITMNRRRYYVPSPLSLWHLDSNHKLIRYMIVHVPIDNHLSNVAGGVLFFTVVWMGTAVA